MAIEKYKLSQVAKAIKDNNGLLTYAAKALKCDYHTIQNYINRHPSLRKVRDEIDDTILDLCENKIHELINDGDADSIWKYIKYKGRKRGYIESTDSNVSLKGTLNTNTTINKLAEEIRNDADASEHLNSLVAKLASSND